MLTCTICRFETWPDDVQMQGPAGRCVCLRCYAREVNDEHRMDKQLRCQIEAMLAELEAALTDRPSP